MIIDHKWPEPDRDGGSIDAVNLTETLIALGYHVVFAALHGSPETLSYRDQLAARGAHCFGPEDAPSVQAFVERYGDTICLFVLSRHAHGGQYLELIRYNWPHAKIMFNTVDLHFLREEREARLTGNAAVARVARHTREREQFLALKSDVTVVVSPAEKALLSAAVPGANIAVLPLGRPARTSPVPPFEARHDIGFIGGYAHVPNVDAVRFFLSDVWPLVRAELPDCRFLIAGAGLPEGVVSGEDDRVIAQGHVAELDAWFDRVRLTVAPLRYGAGLKGKVVSSLAAGVPCVGSSVAIEGIPVVAGEDTLVADTPEMIAAEIIRLYRDPALWARISEAGRLRAGQVY
jgi:glycosyltransferase involved in cell wall biosynthesis